MKILVSGDSFTEGLIKVPERNKIEERKRINWVTQLQQITNYQTINIAQNGKGTDFISYSIRNYLSKAEDTNYFVIAAFSALERQLDDNNYYDYMYNPPHVRTENIEELMYKNEMMIRGLHQYLDELKIPHFFLNSYVDPKYFEVKDVLFSLGNSDIHKYWLNWKYDSNTLYNIICQNYLEPSPKYIHSTQNEEDFHHGEKYIAGCLHPNEEGHKLIAKTIAPYIDLVLNKKPPNIEYI